MQSTAFCTASEDHVDHNNFVQALGQLAIGNAIPDGHCRLAGQTSYRKLAALCAYLACLKAVWPNATDGPVGMTCGNGRTREREEKRT